MKAPERGAVPERGGGLRGRLVVGDVRAIRTSLGTIRGASLLTSEPRHYSVGDSRYARFPQNWSPSSDGFALGVSHDCPPPTPKTPVCPFASTITGKSDLVCCPNPLLGGLTCSNFATPR